MTTKYCLKCGYPRSEPTGDPDEACPSCGAIYAKVEAASKYGPKPGRVSPIRQTTPLKNENELPIPGLSYVFFALAVLALLGGIVLFFGFLPDEPPDGYDWKAAAYIPSLAWLVAGIFESAVLAAIGLSLAYLRGIYMNTKAS